MDSTLFENLLKKVKMRLDFLIYSLYIKGLDEVSFLKS